MSLLSLAKDFFLPSPEVGAQRRKQVFGTESKAVATAGVAVGATALYLAPGFIASGGLASTASKVGGLVSRSFAAKPLATTVALGVGAPLAVGAVINDPTTVTKVPVSVGNFEKNLFSFGKDPSVESAKRIIKENPVVSTLAATAGLVAVGGTAAGVANLIATERNTQAIKDAIPQGEAGKQILVAPSSLPASPTPLSEIEPVTRETQVLGREPSKRGLSTRKRAKEERSLKNSVRVNILNQNTYIRDTARRGA